MKPLKELKKTNEAPLRARAYLAEAQTLSHTAVSAGTLPPETFWSEESFRIFRIRTNAEPTVQLALDGSIPRTFTLCRKRSTAHLRERSGFGTPIGNAPMVLSREPFLVAP